MISNKYNKLTNIEFNTPESNGAKVDTTKVDQKRKYETEENSNQPNKKYKTEKDKNLTERTIELKPSIKKENASKIAFEIFVKENNASKDLEKSGLEEERYSEFKAIFKNTNFTINRIVKLLQKVIDEETGDTIIHALLNSAKEDVLEIFTLIMKKLKNNNTLKREEKISTIQNLLIETKNKDNIRPYQIGLEKELIIPILQSIKDGLNLNQAQTIQLVNGILFENPHEEDYTSIINTIIDKNFKFFDDINELCQLPVNDTWNRWFTLLKSVILKDEKDQILINYLAKIGVMGDLFEHLITKFKISKDVFLSMIFEWLNFQTKIENQIQLKPLIYLGGYGHLTSFAKKMIELLKLNDEEIIHFLTLMNINSSNYFTITAPQTGMSNGQTEDLDNFLKLLLTNNVIKEKEVPETISSWLGFNNEIDTVGFKVLYRSFKYNTDKNNLQKILHWIINEKQIIAKGEDVKTFLEKCALLIQSTEEKLTKKPITDKFKEQLDAVLKPFFEANNKIEERKLIDDFDEFLNNNTTENTDTYTTSNSNEIDIFVLDEWLKNNENLILKESDFAFLDE